MVARASRDSWAEAAGVAAQAQAISDRAMELAQADGKVWADALAVLREAEAGSDGDARRDFRLEQKLERAAAVPLEIAALGADAATLATLVGERGDGTYRGDASAAAALAAGGARAAAHLVRVNLGVGAESRIAAPAAAGSDHDAMYCVETVAPQRVHDQRVDIARGVEVDRTSARRRGAVAVRMRHPKPAADERRRRHNRLLRHRWKPPKDTWTPRVHPGIALGGEFGHSCW